MTRVNKHKALQDWVSEFLTDNYLHFETADAYPGVRTIVPNYGDYTDKTDILGNKYKSYTFMFVAFEKIDTGTSDVNVRNMQLMDTFNEWLESQQETLSFPDFGENCSEYEIEILQNMANLAMITEDGLAKYMLGTKIKYKEA